MYGIRNACVNTLHLFKERGVLIHSIHLGGQINGSGVGAILFTVMRAFADFERSHIASRISEVKQMRKAQGFYVGGRRGFGFDVVDG
jgi:putative DNA-invertase from lambdoid prophage Rac